MTNTNQDIEREIPRWEKHIFDTCQLTFLSPELNDGELP